MQPCHRRVIKLCKEIRMSELTDAAPDHTGRNGAIRAAIGLLQGVALYFLFTAAQDKTWPATAPALFAPLCTAAIFVPLIAVSGLSHLRLRDLVIWSVAVALISFGLAWHDIDRDPVIASLTSTSTPRNLPAAHLWLGLSAGLFIAHSLIVAAASEHRRIASYPSYFATAWKLGLQLALAVLFTGLFWGVLWLGAELFKLIKISFFAETLRKSWFWIPATTVALTCALHVTDVRAGIVRGVRTVVCNLLAWLLPLLTLIAAGFVVALPFTGLAPLWDTKRAAAILLIAAASLVFLLNAAVQDGTRLAPRDATPPLPRLLRGAIIAASLVLLPLVALAGYAIALRVGQYGWSPSRVIATACTLIAACYVIGYVAAALRLRAPLPVLAATNVATSFVILASLVALLTPLADPARIAVADQIARLTAGSVAPNKIDYLFLRFGAGRYGIESLQALAAQPQTQPVAAQNAAEALEKRTRWAATPPQPPISNATRAANITVAQPPGASLPREFLETVWSKEQRFYLLPRCLVAADTCDAVLVDLDGDGIAEIILQPRAGPVGVFHSIDNHAWSFLGTLVGSACAGVRDALIAGRFKIAEPELKDLDLGGQRLRLTPSADCMSGPISIKKN
uniref:DUF4153 domain-containing protein n=1 Tax=Rhodopseudomonas palustris (strain BisA53) TaxID=316055 RepID=Q07ME6_RHOP5